MKNHLKIGIVACVIAVTFAVAHAVDITVATNTQLLEQFLMPNESLAKKQKAIEGAKWRLGLPDNATNAQVSDSLKVVFREWLRDGYKAKQQVLNAASIKGKADSTAAADLWNK